MAKQLTRKQMRFVEEYLVDLDDVAAVKRAGYTQKRADTVARRLLSQTAIVEAIDEAMSDRSRRLGVTQDMVLREIAKIAFFDIRQMFNDDGSVKPPSEWDEAAGGAVANLEVVKRTIPGTDPPLEEKTYKIRLWDKGKQIELAGRHLRMFADKAEVELGTKAAEFFSRLPNTTGPPGERGAAPERKKPGPKPKPKEPPPAPSGALRTPLTFLDRDKDDGTTH